MSDGVRKRKGKNRERGKGGWERWVIEDGRIQRVFINITIVRAPSAVFFIPYLLSQVCGFGPGYTHWPRSYIFERAICDRLASTEKADGTHRWNRPAWPLKRSHDTRNISFRGRGCTRSVSRETTRRGESYPNGSNQNPLYELGISNRYCFRIKFSFVVLLLSVLWILVGLVFLVLANISYLWTLICTRYHQL